MITWSEPVCVTLDSTDQTPGRSRAGYSFSRLNVYTTSAGVMRVPLENLTPLRMVKVSVLLPSLHLAVASHGVVLPLCRVFTKTSGS